LGNLARNYQQPQKAEPLVKSNGLVKTRKSWLTPGEKVIGIAFLGLVCFGAVHIISNESAVYQVNKNVQDVQASINEQQKVNSDLEAQVKELSRYDRIISEAKKKGLVLNENNVKVVPGK
jgi:cell division protein FtsL